MKHNLQTIEPQLIQLVQQLLSESGVEYVQRKVTLEASLQRHLGIDSLGRAELFRRIEKSFDVQLPDNLIAEAETLREVAEAILNASPKQKAEPHEIQDHLQTKIHVDPTHAKTLIDVLMLYAKSDPSRVHIYLQDENGKEEPITYGKLFDTSLRVAHEMQRRGLKPGDTVAIMQPTNPGFFYTFFGTLLAGCIPVPIYPPFRLHQIESYAKQEAKILKNAEARMLVTFHEAESLSKMLRAFVPSLKKVITVDELLKHDDKASIYDAKEDDFAMIQYTSGSTNAPKGVLLTHANLMANIRAYGESVKLVPEDVVVSWAPLYHDMGLIGMWFGSLYNGVPLILMSPLTFLNRPERWLWAIHYHRGTLSGGPNFSFELCVRKIEPSMIEGLDLSSWRVAINGAEPIQAKTIKRFTEKFSQYGFKPEAMVPAYGLAESSVCVAMSPLNRAPRIDRIERKAFEEKGQALPTTDEHGLEFVACGIPIPRHDVQIVDEFNRPLPDRHVGQLQFKGPSSMQGYYGNPEATLAIYHQGWWDSGDFAYLSEKEIFITGRRKDIIIKAGRNLYPTEIEELTGQISGIRKGCVIAFSVNDAQNGTEKLIVVAETSETKVKNKQKISELISEKIVTALDVSPDHVLLVTPQTIPKTSSGKLQRAACKTAYLSGNLTKRHTPLWMQFTKITMGSGFAKLRKQLGSILKLLYSSYIYFLVAVSILPILMCAWIFPRHVFAYLFKCWARSMFFFAFCPIIIEGKKYLSLPNPLIFAANHTSYIDTILMLAILPVGARMIAKQELLSAPVIGNLIRRLEFISVDRQNQAQSIEDTKQMEKFILQKNSLAIFPEGTFGYGAGLRPFRLGAFKIAADTNTPVCPIAIRGLRQILRGETRLFRPGTIHITVSEPIPPEGHEWQNITDLKNKVRMAIAKNCGEPSLNFIASGIAED